jgi:hypothetical protein
MRLHTKSNIQRQWWGKSKHNFKWRHFMCISKGTIQSKLGLAQQGTPTGLCRRTKTTQNLL